MLAIAPSNPSNRKTITANILPASIKHDGPIPFHSRYWDPRPIRSEESHSSATNQPPKDSTTPPLTNESNEGQQASPDTSSSEKEQSRTLESYFRGRRLLGRAIPVPQGYEGLVLAKTDNKLPAKPPTVEQLRRMEGDWNDDGDEEEMALEEDVEVKMLEESGRFDEVVVWGHEALPEEGEDVYMRGLGEWVKFAQAIHSYQEPQTD